MLQLSRPVRLQSIRPILSLSEGLSERIAANYAVFAARVAPEELLFLLTAGQGDTPAPDSSLFQHFITNRSYDSSFQIGIVSNLFNRILASDPRQLTYQDSVFVSSLLQKLGISDFRTFYDEVWTMREQSLVFTEKTDSLRTVLENVRLLEGLYRNPARPPQTAELLRETPEPSARFSERVFTRLHTRELLSVMQRFSSTQTRFSQSVSARELGSMRHTRILNWLRECRTRETVRAEYALSPAGQRMEPLIPARETVSAVRIGLERMNRQTLIRHLERRLLEDLRRLDSERYSLDSQTRILSERLRERFSQQLFRVFPWKPLENRPHDERVQPPDRLAQTAAVLRDLPVPPEKTAEPDSPAQLLSAFHFSLSQYLRTGSNDPLPEPLRTDADFLPPLLPPLRENTAVESRIELVALTQNEQTSFAENDWRSARFYSSRSLRQDAQYSSRVTADNRHSYFREERREACRTPETRVETPIERALLYVSQALFAYRETREQEHPVSGWMDLRAALPFGAALLDCPPDPVPAVPAIFQMFSAPYLPMPPAAPIPMESSGGRVRRIDSETNRLIQSSVYQGIPFLSPSPVSDPPAAPSTGMAAPPPRPASSAALVTADSIPPLPAFVPPPAASRAEAIDAPAFFPADMQSTSPADTANPAEHRAPAELAQMQKTQEAALQAFRQNFLQRNPFASPVRGADKTRTIQDSLRALENPAAFRLEIAAQSAAEKTAARMELPTVPEAADPLTRSVLEAVIARDAYGADASRESGFLRPGASLELAGILRESAREEAPAAMELAAAPVPAAPPSVAASSFPHDAQPPRHGFRPEFPTPADVMSPRAVPIVHKQVFPSEPSDEMAQTTGVPRSETQTTREETSAQDRSTETIRTVSTETTVTAETRAAMAEDVSKIVTRAINQQMGIITERVCGNIEKRMRTDRARRGM